MGGEAERLDPESRALLELSVVRGIPDEELAGVLGIDAEGVRQRRERVMRELGAESVAEREALEAALREGVREPALAPAEAEPPRPPLERLPDPEPTTPAARNRARAIAAAGGLAIAIVVALMLALGGDDTEFVPSSPPAGSGGEPAPGGRLAALGGGPGNATATIVGPEGERALRLKVRGLPRPERGGYVVWLYNSISDARPLTGARRDEFSVREPLPPDAGDYGFIDISREPADGNPNHSGQSMLRIARGEIPGG